MPVTKPVLALFLLLCPAQFAGQQAESPTLDIVHLTLTCPASPCRFRQGELIPVDLTFRANLWGYGVASQDTNRYESEQDRFEASPAEDVIDAMRIAASKFVDVAKGATLIGLRTLDPLSGHSTETVRLELNQWLYFQRPGKYKVRATSRRMCRGIGDCLELTSEPIEIEIVAAGSAWQRQELDRLIRALPTATGRREASERAAVRALAFLGTDDALKEVQNHVAANPVTDPIWRLAESYLLQVKANPVAR